MASGDWVRGWKRAQMPKTIRRPRLAMEMLEDRTTPAVSVVQNGGLLTVSLSEAADAVTIGGQLGASLVIVSNSGFGVFPYVNVTSIEVANTSGVAGTQLLRFQDNFATAGQILLTGSLTVTGIHTVDFSNPLLPLAANGGVTISGGSFITQSNALPQLLASGAIRLSTSGSGDAIGAAANPLRIVGNSAFLTTNTSAGNGNQFFDLGGSGNIVSVNGGSAGPINAGTGTVTLTNGQFFGAAGSDFGNTTTLNIGTGGILTVFHTETIGGLTGTGLVGAGGPGTSTLVVGGGNVSSTFGGNLQNVAGQNAGNGVLALQKTGTGTFTLNGANTFTGGTTVNGGTLKVIGVGAANRLAINSQVTVGSGGIFEIGDTNPLPTVANSIDVTLNGGILQLSGASNGGSHVRNITFNNGGTVRAAGSISSFANANLAVNGTVTVTGSSSTPASFDLPNGIAIDGTHVFNVADITGDANPDLVFPSTSGIRNGSPAGAVTKTGAGTLQLGAANSYTGSTSVSGTLLINGTVTGDVTASLPLSVIGGSGTIQGATVVASGGSLLPGNAGTVGILSTGNITFNSGSSFGVKLPGFVVGDSLNVTGTVNLGGATLFAIDSLAALGRFTIIHNDGTDPIIGTFAGLPEGATFTGDNGKPFLITYRGGDGNDVVLTPETLPTRLLATGPGTGGGVLLNVTAGSTYGSPQNVSLIPGFGGEIRVARVDVNGDGPFDLVSGSGPGGSRIRIISGVDNSTVIADFDAFPGFAGGVYVAGGDLNGDGFGDLVVTGDGADAFSGPVANWLQVRVYSGATLTGSNPPLLANFNGLASLSGAQGEGANVRLGGRPAVADVNGDARPDVLIAAGNGGGPRVVIWPAQAFLTASSGQPPVNPIANLFVFEPTQRGGAFLTAGDLNGDGFADIAVGGGPGGGPRVRTVNAFLMLGLPNLEAVNLDDPVNLANGLVLNNFFSGNPDNRGGVRVAMRDADLDGLADLVTASGTNELSQIRIYTDTSVNAAFGSSSEPSGPQVIDPFSALLPGGIWIG